MPKFLSVLVTLALISVLLVPVSAGGNAWIELLETNSIQTNGENNFVMSSSTTVTIPVGIERKLQKIDLLIWHLSGHRPTNASVTLGSTTSSLTIYAIDSNITRITGNIPAGFYQSIKLKLTKSSSTSTTMELLSAKVSPFGTLEYAAEAQAVIDGVTYPCPFNMAVEGSGVQSEDKTVQVQFPIAVYDWQKYDKVVICGSVGGIGLNSVRSTLAGKAVSYDMSYTSSNSTGSYGSDVSWSEWSYYSYDDSYAGTTETESFRYSTYQGKTLFNITIDLTGLDRNVRDPLLVYFTGVYNQWDGYSVQMSSVFGSVDTADTDDLTWWNRFTSFMSSLFGNDDPAADDFQQDMEQQSNQMQEAVDEMEQVTKPDVEDLELSMDEYLNGDGSDAMSGFFTALFGNQLIVTMIVISLTCAFIGYALYGKR